MKKVFLFILVLVVLVVVGFFGLSYLNNSFGINAAYFERLFTYRNCYKTGDQKLEGASELGIEGILINHGSYYTVEQPGAPISYRFTNIKLGSDIEKVIKSRADGAAINTSLAENNFIIQNGTKIPDPDITKRGSVHDVELLSICFK